MESMGQRGYILINAHLHCGSTLQECSIYQLGVSTPPDLPSLDNVSLYSPGSETIASFQVRREL